MLYICLASIIALALAQNTSINVRHFDPRPINVTLNSLPRPFASQSANKSPNVIPIPANPTLNVPQGFRVNVFADQLDQPRWLALTPAGEVLVTETHQNRIRLLRDTDGDGDVDESTNFATADNGLNIPFGMTFTWNYTGRHYNFYLGNTNEVRAYRYEFGQRQLTGRGWRVTDLPGGGYNQHWTRNVVRAPDWSQLYVSVGSQSNNNVEAAPRASVLVMNLDGSGKQTFASGLRNPVGLAFHPRTGELYTTVNERDGLGDDLVPDYLTRIRKDEFFGWPYVYLAPTNIDPRLRASDGRSTRPDMASKTRTPDVLFQAHSAALGLQFYDQTAFPTKYWNGAFAAFRGSWNRNAGTGYKVVFVPFTDAGRPAGYYEDFVTGFLSDPQGPTTWGRPVGILVLGDGSLLFTEEMNGRIYRVSYSRS